MKFWIDIEDSAGNKQGDGPITTALFWEHTKRLDKAGKFRFQMPTMDYKAGLVVAKYIARCWGVVDGVLTDLGAGIIDQINTVVGNDGKAVLTASGDDLLRQLAYRQVGDLVIDNGSGGADTSGPADIIALAPSGWTLDTTNGYNATSQSIEHTFEGESVLAAFARLAELTGEHFRLGVGKKVVWIQNDSASSGVRAIQGGDASNLESNDSVCIILQLSEEKNSYDTITRVYPYGSGEGSARVTLAGTTLSILGYTIDEVNNYIAYDAGESALGDHIDAYMTWPDVDDPTMLTVQASEYLFAHQADTQSYRLKVAKLVRAIDLGDTLQIVYYRHVDGVRVMEINDDFYVMETTTRVDGNGMSTTDMLVCSDDSWPETDETLIWKEIEETRRKSRHTQMTGEEIIQGAWTNYSATSTVVGWSSYTDKYIYYQKLGTLVFVQFRIFGTSDATGVTFTLPYSAGNYPRCSTPIRIYDNGVAAIGLLEMVEAGNVVTCYPTMGGGTWTASGTKRVAGQFWFEVA